MNSAAFVVLRLLLASGAVGQCRAWQAGAGTAHHSWSSDGQLGPVWRMQAHHCLQLVCSPVRRCPSAHAQAFACLLCTRRGLRVLRVASQIPGVHVVLEALRRLLPALVDVLWVGLLFYYIFAVRVGACAG